MNLSYIYRSNIICASHWGRYITRTRHKLVPTQTWICILICVSNNYNLDLEKLSLNKFSLFSLRLQQLLSSAINANRWQIPIVVRIKSMALQTFVKSIAILCRNPAPWSCCSQWPGATRWSRVVSKT